MWGAGAALGAVGGVLMALIVPLTPDIGVATLVRGFSAMTLGGFGSLHGAVIGGLLLGIMEKVLGFYVSTAFIDITAYLVTILVLLIRPKGLFGQHATLRI
jgi:branched-chain amino acid transport system permease protein